LAALAADVPSPSLGSSINVTRSREFSARGREWGVGVLQRAASAWPTRDVSNNYRAAPRVLANGRVRRCQHSDRQREDHRFSRSRTIAHRDVLRRNRLRVRAGASQPPPPQRFSEPPDSCDRLAPPRRQPRKAAANRSLPWQFKQNDVATLLALAVDFFDCTSSPFVG